MIYRTKWGKSSFPSFFQYLRDWVIYYLPVRRLPGALIRRFYGVSPRFVFLVHPRRSEDIFVALPFLSVLRRFLSKTKALKLIRKIPPFVITPIRTEAGHDGVVVSGLHLPESLMGGRKETLKEYYRALKFVTKITDKGSFLGLGAWWPIVTRRGLVLKDVTEKNGITVTNGHTGTLVSLCLMSRKLARLAGVGRSELNIAIIGAGKMGTNLGKVLIREVNTLGIIDVNEKRLTRLSSALKRIDEDATVEEILRTENTDMARVLDKYHFAICVTSNARRIIRSDEIPENFVVIDDSRPEAISRENLGDGKVVLEEGLLKIKGIMMGYDYGFGVDENVFGCLAEAYALTVDGGRVLSPTQGDVDMDNFYRMLRFSESNGIEIGDFKTQDRTISEGYLKGILKKRALIAQESIKAFE